MIPKYDLIDDNDGEIIAHANELMTNEQIDQCTFLTRYVKYSFLFADTGDDYFPVFKLENVCY